MGTMIFIAFAGAQRVPVWPKPPGPRSEGAKVRNFLEPDAVIARHDQLCDALPVADLEGFLPQVDQQHTHFATIVGVDRAGR
jgi:hypothetical protein